MKSYDLRQMVSSDSDDGMKAGTSIVTPQRDIVQNFDESKVLSKKKLVRKKLKK